MVPKALKQMEPLFERSDLLKEVLVGAARYAALCGHCDLSDFHCFPVLLSHYPNHPLTVAALADKSVADFSNKLGLLVKNEPPVKKIGGVTCLLWRLIHHMCSDEWGILHCGGIGLVHFYLAYLSRPNNVVYSVYEHMKIDARIVIPAIIDAMEAGDSRVLSGYYLRLHDICHGIRMTPSISYRPKHK